MTDATGDAVVPTDDTGIDVSAEAGNDAALQGDSDAGKTFTIGGTVSGLLGAGLLLQNGSETLAVNGDGAFAFTTTLASGATYAVTVAHQPSSPSQRCVVTRGMSTVGSADVTDVVVDCTTSSFTVGGSVVGLLGSGLVLENDNNDDLAVSSDGTFAFPTEVLSGNRFVVTIKTQPTSPTQTCTISGGSGTVGGGNITGVVVNCQTQAFTVGGEISGLIGNVVLQNNGAGDLTINANGSFAFKMPVSSGAAYAVTVRTQPSGPSQTCLVTNGTGSVGNGPVTSIQVACTTDSFTIGGRVTGLAGKGLVLQNNRGDNLSIGATGYFTFATPIASGGAYSVSVLTQPSSPTQTCIVENGWGAVAASDITTVTVVCSTDTFTIGGTVVGLMGSGMVLQDDGADNKTISANGAFTFATSVSSGDRYDVTILTPPTSPTQACSVSGARGTVGASNVTSVTVTCGAVCTKTITSVLNETNPYPTPVSISYSVVGGGGGAGGGSGFWSSGGGGGSSAILTGATLVSYASGGNGGAEGGSLAAGTNGAVVSGSFMLSAGANLTVYVGGGGGGGGWDFGGGGGSGYYGGAGGEDLSSGNSGGAGGTNSGGMGVNGAGSGSSQAGGSSGPGGVIAQGGAAGTGGASSGIWDGGGGGGGFGGGGGACYNDGVSLPSDGGSNGGSASSVAVTPGGIGANAWSSATTLPAAAGAGGSSAAGQGGNGGLVIMTYASPTGVCSL